MGPIVRILFLSQVLPFPVDAGPKMRSYYVLRHLTQKHQVTLLTFVRETDKPEDIAHLAKFCQAVHTVPMQRTRLRDLKFLTQSLLTQQPFLIIRDQIPAMNVKIQQLVQSEQFDVIHADQLWMAQYALAAKTASPQSKLILDQHNAVYLIPRRLAEADSNPIKQRFLAREARLLTAYEPEVCHRFDHVVWVTAEDRQAVAALPQPTVNRQTTSTVIPICANPTEARPVERAANRCRITFLGGLHWPPNAQGIVWFAKHVFPQVREQIPQAVLTIIGKNPPAGLEGEGIEVTGYVVDPTPYLVETAAFIVPLHAGGGMRVKILDAWSWGLPLVSTTIGAEGIEIEDNKNILIADTAEAFAQAVIRILKNPTLAQQLGQNGRQTVLDKYDWQVTYSAWDEVYNKLMMVER
ncbi:MAG: glycosyl transferase family 1 [Chloroflexota bacterium]|nr:MAG: glycosyl transferase family 1 [Chloroflexota bacterium]